MKKENIKIFLKQEWFRLSLLFIVVLFFIIYVIIIPTQNKKKYNSCLEKVSNYNHEYYIDVEGGGKSVAEKRQDYCIKKLQYI